MKISRRDFLKSSAAGALSMAAAGVLNPGVAFAESEGEKAPEAVNTYKVMSELNPQDYDSRDGDTDLSAVFSPWKFGGLQLNHRMVKAAAGSDTQRGSVEEAVEYYAAFAKGGVEMIYVEDCLQYGDHFVNSRAMPIEDSHIKEVIKGVHDAGGYIGYQLSCMGFAFSGFDPKTAAQFETAHADDLTREEIQFLQEDFINGAKKLPESRRSAVTMSPCTKRTAIWAVCFSSRMPSRDRMRISPI